MRLSRRGGPEVHERSGQLSLEHKLRSDLNGALNILKKANAAVSTVRKPLSFLVDYNLVAPVKGV